ncbi:hypothetical protein HPP92_018972 [Vanilla planifolia]|uniref:C2 domain-containing protein n=1 Tax=Vanilla planifolia TaxID=51239 RepID=A0A835Q9E8_VANPL|nr:hypothetical protein HPP92_018972 [Vanilla planifolia]
MGRERRAHTSWWISTASGGGRGLRQGTSIRNGMRSLSLSLKTPIPWPPRHWSSTSTTTRRTYAGTFLGKVKISGSSFASSGSETLVYYPLEKRSVFSQVKGEIGLKVYYVDDASPPPADQKPEMPPAAEEKKEATNPEDKEKKTEGEKAEEPKAEEKDTEKEKKPEETQKTEEEKKPDETNKVEEAKQTKKPDETQKEGEAKQSEGEGKTKQDLPLTALSSPAKQAKHSRLGELEIKTRGSERPVGSYDLVDRVPYLFVRLLKAKEAGADANAVDHSVFAQIVIGSYTVRTRKVKLNTEWDQVFSFHKESLNSTSLEISVHEEKKEGETTTENSLGAVCFDLPEIPKRAPPDCPLAPQWYTLETSSPELLQTGEVMLAIWIGTQADEAFPEAWQSDSGGLLVHTRSKAYLSPKLWYLRLTVIQTQDLRLPSIADAKSRNIDLYVKAQLGSQLFKTSKVPLCSSSAAANPTWNEDLLLVAADPFDPFLTVSVEDATSCRPVGHSKVPLATIHRRIDDHSEPPSRWLNLTGDDPSRPYVGRVHVRVCLEGGYHVLEEAAHVASDVRAASKQLSKPPIGLLEVGVRGASNLIPIKAAKDSSSGSTDAYVVLKYGPKWARTRTILDQFNPRWNEQYAWDVFDPCTVLTVAVFDNSRAANNGKAPRDSRIGKVRVRLSTLDTNRVYVNNFPLTVVTPLGGQRRWGSSSSPYDSLALPG